MKRLLLRWLLLTLSVVAASLICESLGLGFQVKLLHDKSLQVQAFAELLGGVAILGLLNATLRPLLKMMTMPLTCLTLGLFSFVVNAFVLWMAAALEIGFRITNGGLNGFLAALVGSFLISCINAVLGVFLSDKKDD
jgi:putative membrane protein